MMSEMEGSTSLIFDLRGNRGGFVESLRMLLGNFFEGVKDIARQQSRDEQIVEKTEITSRSPFTGKLIVLVDSWSVSGAELFGRVIQLEKRGIVIGDRTAGALSTGLASSHGVGAGTVAFYTIMVTKSKIVMMDGNTIEGVGVIPDEIIIPTEADLAAGRDPVLAHAAALLGVSLSPEEAGKMFPVEWGR